MILFVCMYVYVFLIKHVFSFYFIFFAQQFFPLSHCYCHEYFLSCTAGGLHMKTIQISLKSRAGKEKWRKEKTVNYFFVLHCSIAQIVFCFCCCCCCWFLLEIRIHTVGTTNFIIHHISLESLSLRMPL